MEEINLEQKAKECVVSGSYIAMYIDKLEKELSEQTSLANKLKCCFNCKHYDGAFFRCDKQDICDFKNMWECC